MPQRGVLPVDPEAEVQVLGSMIVSAEAADAVSPVLVAEDFSSDFHRATFRAIETLRASGDPVDATSVSRVLEGAKAMPTGGRLAVLDLVERVSSPAFASYHARTVADLAMARKFIEIAERTRQDMTAVPNGHFKSMPELVGTAVDSLVETARRRGTDGLISISELVNDAFEKLEPGKIGIGVPTGFVDLDRLLFGLHPENLVVVAARPGVGKSAFVTSLARNVAGQGKPVLFFSLEMSRREIGMRLVTAEARVSWETIRADRVAKHEWFKLTEAAESLFGLPLYVSDSGATSISDIRSAARKVRPGLVVLDYLQLAAGNRSRGQNRQEEVAELSRALKLLAKDFSVPVVACSQLNRNPEGRADKRPTLADLRESGAIEQDADVVILLHRSADDPGRCDANVAKHRNGPTDIIKLAFLGWLMRFENWAAPS